MEEIKRDRYLKQLIDSQQNGFIKVITGIRRCGKSYLLNVLFYHYLLDNGVAKDHIIRIDLEDRLNKELRNPDTMLHYVHDRIKDSPKRGSRLPMRRLTAPPTRQKQNISPVLVYANSNCRTMMCPQLLLSFAAIRSRHFFCP